MQSQHIVKSLQGSLCGHLRVHEECYNRTPNGIAVSRADGLEREGGIAHIQCVVTGQLLERGRSAGHRPRGSALHLRFLSSDGGHVGEETQDRVADLVGHGRLVPVAHHFFSFRN